jgi:hypothetical protein
MLATTTPSPKSVPLPIGLVIRSSSVSRPANRLDRKDFSRDARLLDASIAGVVLSFNPRDDEMREKAERSWETIRALLAEHLLAQTDSALPWDGDAVGSTTASDLLKKRYAEIRSLARTVASVSFEAGSDGEIAEAGKALCRLAVKLDDLMEATERRLVIQLRRYVFSSGEETRLSA